MTLRLWPAEAEPALTPELVEALALALGEALAAQWMADHGERAVPNPAPRPGTTHQGTAAHLDPLDGADPLEART
jgi:hypothetical protein